MIQDDPGLTLESFDHWKLSGSAGGTLLMPFGPLNVPQEATPTKMYHFLGPIRESFFEYFVISWGMFLSIVFC